MECIHSHIQSVKCGSFNLGEEASECGVRGGGGGGGGGGICAVCLGIHTSRRGRPCVARKPRLAQPSVQVRRRLLKQASGCEGDFEVRFDDSRQRFGNVYPVFDLIKVSIGLVKLLHALA